MLVHLIFRQIIDIETSQFYREHNMIRFKDGSPQAIWYSQHSNGEAFTYDCVEKYDDGIRVRCFEQSKIIINFLKRFPSP